MKNPWLKKNPLLSMWLSGANAIAGSIRGHATAQARRQANAAIKKGTKQMMALWTGAPAAPKRTRKKK
ncbi:MAG: hypothetical protein HYS18_10835 [Burkholderiales bacterium]|nr:hypothetical protein [Burkholderiales bacterium]